MSAPVSIANGVREVLARITDAWRRGQPEAMEPLLHPNVVMVRPDFSGRLEGRDAFIASFRDFARKARVNEYLPGNIQVDGDSTTAVAQYPFEMVYERDGGRWRSTGWDIWAFSRDGDNWIAVWRTMQALAEQPADLPAG